jgi:hypothetical protein
MKCNKTVKTTPIVLSVIALLCSFGSVFAQQQKSAVHANQIIERSQPSSHAAENGAGVISDIGLISRNPVVFDGSGLAIKNSQHHSVRYLIHDSRGRVIKKGELGSSGGLRYVELAGCNPGAYIYTITIGRSVYTQAFVISK